MRSLTSPQNSFHIRVPYYGAWTKYGWQKNDWGIGLNKEKIDRLAQTNEKALVSYGKSTKKHKIEARKVQQYPIEQIKYYNTQVYIVPKSAFK